MERHLPTWLLGALAVIWLAACDGRKANLLTPVSSGRSYELLVVADAAVWNRPAGRALQRVLEADVPGLPQSEPSFRLMHASPRHFDATLRLVRNIIVVEVDSSRYARAAFSYARDVYAVPQTVLTVQAPDEQALQALLEERGDALVRFFTQVEMERRMHELEERHSVRVSDETEARFGCTVWVPDDLKAFKTGQDFFWAGTNAATDDRNFVMYSFPYTDAAVFTQGGFVHKRDSVMKVNIPGARPGMYMSTDSLMTDVCAREWEGRFALEVRGLWRVKGDFMGGPFVALARVDERRRRVVVAEVFVYAPDRPKRNLVRSMEASLYTWRWLEAKEEP